MTIKIEKDTRWNQHNQAVTTSYYVWVDGRIAALFSSEEEARELIEKIKSTYVKPTIETIHEEEL